MSRKEPILIESQQGRIEAWAKRRMVDPGVVETGNLFK
jgi:hypothetical protein